jgi:y4mF family transcriptional regulator
VTADQLGRRIRERRKGLGITQQGLAEISGVSLHTLSDLESGKANPTLTTLVQVLTPLGLQIDVHVRSLS